MAVPNFLFFSHVLCSSSAKNAIYLSVTVVQYLMAFVDDFAFVSMRDSHISLEYVLLILKTSALAFHPCLGQNVLF